MMEREMEHRRFKFGKRIGGGNISKEDSILNIIDTHFQAYNSARIREICQLYANEICSKDVVIGMSVTGAMTPGGLGESCLVPMIKRNYVDWIVTTGANVYHDIHFAMGLPLHRGTPFVDDSELLDQDIVRIYDVFMGFEVLAKTDLFLMDLFQEEWFNRRMGTAELHYKLGEVISERLKDDPRLSERSFVIAAYESGVPIYVPSPGDSSLGLNIAALNLMGRSIMIDSSIDVNEISAIVYEAKTGYGKSATIIWGGGSPKNFLLQTEPQLQEILGFQITGHDYFVQVTDARPDTGGLSGATPSEAVSWNKVNPEMLPNAIVCYADITIVMPLVVSYLVQQNVMREPKNLYSARSDMMEKMKNDFLYGTGTSSTKPGVNETVKMLKKLHQTYNKQR